MLYIACNMHCKMLMKVIAFLLCATKNNIYSLSCALRGVFFKLNIIKRKGSRNVTLNKSKAA